MSNKIVNLNVQLQLAPAPSTLQRTGALLSQGATNTTPGTLSLLTAYGDLSPLLAGQVPLTGIAWQAGASFTAAIAGNVLTASAVSGVIYRGAQVIGDSVPPNTIIVSLGTGAGGAGTYNLNNSATVSSESMTTTGAVLVATSAPHGLPIATPVEVTIAGCTPSGYNGTFLAVPIDTNHFCYPLVDNPGGISSLGVWTPAGASELNAMALSFFAQGGSVAVYVLELGAVSDTEAIAYLGVWLAANEQVVYTLLTPRSWDGNQNFLDLISLYESPTSKLYFFVTTTLATYHYYTLLMKDVWAVIDAPKLQPIVANPLTAISYLSGTVTATTLSDHGVLVGDWFQINGCVPTAYNGWHQATAGTTGSALIYSLPTDPGTAGSLGTLVENQAQSDGSQLDSEFTAASMMWQILHDNPSNTFNLAPYSFRFIFGVTPFEKPGMSPTLAALKAANVNTAQLCDEGGISNTGIYWGRTMDGKPFNFWYGVDWMQINAARALANEVINGSNNSVNPLDYNQAGINRLEGRTLNVVKSAITFRMCLGVPVQLQMDGPALADALDNNQFAGQAVVNAVPFIPYSLANPSHYSIGEYDGLSILFVPLRGFESILLNIVASQFIATP